MPQTQEARKAETRARLLAAAADLFADQGIDAVSVDSVAEAAGRTSGAVYAHFGSKQGLLLALLEWWKDAVVTLLFADVAVSDSPAGQLASVWQHVSGAGGEATDRWTLLDHELWLRAARDSEVRDVLSARDAEARAKTARHLAQWTGAVGATPPCTPESSAVLVKALLTGLAMQQRLEPGLVSDELAVAGLAALLGLAGRGRRTLDGTGPGHTRSDRAEPERTRTELPTIDRITTDRITIDRSDHHEETSDGH